MSAPVSDIPYVHHSHPKNPIMQVMPDDEPPVFLPKSCLKKTFPIFLPRNVLERNILDFNCS
jgi:hypothetical protein